VQAARILPAAQQSALAVRKLSSPKWNTRLLVVGSCVPTRNVKEKRWCRVRCVQTLTIT